MFAMLTEEPRAQTLESFRPHGDRTRDIQLGKLPAMPRGTQNPALGAGHAGQNLTLAALVEHTIEHTFSHPLFPRPFRDVSAVGFSWKPPHTTTAFVGPSNSFDFRRLRFLPVETGPDRVNVDRLLQLGHESFKVLLAGVQDLAQFRAGPHRLLIRIPSFGKKRKLFNERSSVLGELVQRFRVRRHGW